MSDFFSIISGLSLLSSGFMDILYLVMYIFTALAVYQMSKTMNLGSPWLAFIPVANVYAFGRLARACDQSLNPNKRARNYGVLLLVFSILSGVLAGIGLIMMVVSVFGALGGLGGWPDFYDEFGYMAYNYDYYYDDMMPYLDEFVSLAVPALLLILLGSVFAIIYAVYYFIALHKVYKTFTPENTTAFLLLSIFIAIVRPFLLFSIRNRIPAVNGGAYGYPPVPPQYPGAQSGYAQPGAYPTYQPQPPQYTSPQYGAQQPDSYTAPQYGAQQPDSYTAPQYGAQQPDSYTAPQYGQSDSGEQSQSSPESEDPWNRP